MSRVIYYHFTDLHFKQEDDFDREQVLAALWSDIDNQMEEGLVPDFIVVTGDIAFSAQETEYTRARTLFFTPLAAKFGIERQRFYLVPGNHDFDKACLAHLRPDTVIGLDARDRVTAFLQDPLNREMYLRPFMNYARFVQDFTTAPYSRTSPAYGYAETVAVSGMKLRIVGLNSCWACHYHGQTHGRALDNERARLLIGEHQWQSAVKSRAEEHAFTITLVHHPLEWLADFDANSLRPEILKTSLILNHGHVHRANELSYTQTPHSGSFILGAAACYDRRVGTDHYANGYAIVTVDFAEQNLSIKVRKYADSPVPHWTSHEDLLGEGSGGRTTFPLTRHRAVVSTGEHRRHATSLFEIYRHSPVVSRHLPAALSALNHISADSQPILKAMLRQYEEMVCGQTSQLHSSGTPEQVGFAVSAFFGEAVIRALYETNKHPALRDTKTIVDKVTEDLVATLPSSQAEIRGVASCWTTLWLRRDEPLHALLATTPPELALLGCLCSFLAVCVTSFSDRRFAAMITGVTQGPEDAEVGAPFSPIHRCRALAGAVVEIALSCASENEFMELSTIRFRIEQRIEQTSEVLASANMDFPLQAIRLNFVGRPELWEEQRFTIDTTRIMSLLMGKELYGDTSKDVWFREVLQNAIDACEARKRLDPDCETGLIQAEAMGEANELVIRDNGVGMSKWHIERYFCRVGRSIWRSEELAKYSQNRQLAQVSLGRFGIGFLSVFEVARRVVVRTRFCRGDAGYTLSISSVKEPFFIRQESNLPVGTEVSIFFRDDYRPDILSIASRYLTYMPATVECRGLPEIPAEPTEALKAAVRHAMTPKGVEWHTEQVPLPDLKATLYVAVPLSQHRFEDKEKFPSTCSVRVSNGGITVYTCNADWIGPKSHSSHLEPSSHVNGVQAVLDFQSGQAPVTISRNEVRVSEPQAKLVLDAIATATSKAWLSFARGLFKGRKSNESNTRAMLQALNNSAKEPSWWARQEWCANELLVKTAVQLLSEFATVSTLQGPNLAEECPCHVSELKPLDTRVVLATAKHIASPLFRLYCSQIKKVVVVKVADKRTISLLQSVNRRWVRIRDDEDLWSAITIKETVGWRLRDLIPADTAIVGNEYFLEKEAIAVLLPRKKTSATVVAGRSRAQLATVPARVLLNAEHGLWQKIEDRLADKTLDPHAVRDAVKMLMSLVINEKAKTRRDYEQPLIIKKLLELADLPEGTPVCVTV